MKQKIIKIFSISLLGICLILPNFVFASNTNGTIDPTYKYAWSENIGWINFGCDYCDVHITDSGMTGYAWSANYGWINLAPDTSGVNNNGEGTLLGQAWGENIGWINFSGVTIDSSGDFSGYASGDITGQISFNCSNTDSCGSSDFKLKTDWRPASTRNSSSDNSNGGGYTPPPSTGNGITDASIGISQTKSGYVVDTKGKNFLAHINSRIGFTVYGNDEKHIAEIEDLDMLSKRIKLVLYSDPVTLYLSPKETKSVDLNGDNIKDIKIKYNELMSNRVDLTFSKLENKIKAKEEGKEEKKEEKNTPTPKKQNYQFTRSLKLGMTENDVKELQKYLNNNGFVLALAGQFGSKGNETEYFGNATKNALIKFQNKYSNEILKPVGLSVGTGYFGPSTIKFVNGFGDKTIAKKEKILNQGQNDIVEKVQSKTSSLFTKGLEIGMKNNDIKRLQELLATLPTIYPEKLTTGYFGLLTEKAVQRFQLKYGIVKSSNDIGFGYVGPRTRSKLGELFGE